MPKLIFWEKSLEKYCKNRICMFFFTWYILMVVEHLLHNLFKFDLKMKQTWTIISHYEVGGTMS